MQLADWRQETVSYKAQQVSSVTCVILPFIQIPGLFEKIFPRAMISYLSLVPREKSYSPILSPSTDLLSDIPLLNLHTDLVESYWNVQDTWRPWSFLENDFTVLRSMGFKFDRGNKAQYCAVIHKAASQFANSVKENAEKIKAEAIAVYGRGHWTMNAAALAANKLNIPLYVIERGILPSSYIVDEGVPFTGPSSSFRRAWDLFRLIQVEEIHCEHQLSESSLNLYNQILTDEELNQSNGSSYKNIIVGQCMFDYNLLNAPFVNPCGFIEYVLQSCLSLQNNFDIYYRPHPLSPEEYPDGLIRTSLGDITVARGYAWDSICTDSILYTWNSTLGLEANLVFNSAIKILDQDCHYRWIESCDQSDKKAYIDFLNKYSIFV